MPPQLALAFFLPLLVGAKTPGGEATSELPPIQLEDDLGGALEKAEQSGKPVVAIFGAVWCPPCRRFKKDTLPSPVLRAQADRYHWVYVDIDRNVSLSRKYKVEGTPSFLLLDAAGAILGRALGVLSADALIDFLETARHGKATPADQPRNDELLGLGHGQMTWLPGGFRGNGICFSQVGYGPLNLRSQSPNQVLRLGLQPRTPSTLAEGQYEVRWTETFANVFAYETNNFRLDYLTVNSDLAVGYGVSDTVQVELSFTNLSRFDSYLDPVTDVFHDIFGLGDSGRDRFPSGDNIIDIDPVNGGVDIEDRTQGTESTDLGLTFQHNLTCGTEILPALSYSVSTRYHAGGNADLRGDSRWSVGVSTSAAQRFFDDFYVYLGLAYTWHGLDEARGLALADEQWSGLLAFEWRYAPECSWVLQYLVSEGVAESRSPFDDPSNEIDLGWKWEYSPGSVFEIGLIENIIEVDNSPDFGLHFGLVSRF